ncbi:hypothetical protein PTQ35_04120 [Campylobacter sp. 46490-21]|uniref:hypothetical protein n=1 Tax=Campylobacter magnus TaxID=3026462 RepID=UPI00235F27DA|nr:hypothetical protein [Campylobacter magnus]MDD0848003.1 hypothetical protein [Campylobacter magnus]
MSGDSSRSTILLRNLLGAPKSYGNTHGSVNFMFYLRRAHRRLLAPRIAQKRLVPSGRFLQILENSRIKV